MITLIKAEKTNKKSINIILKDNINHILPLLEKHIFEISNHLISNIERIYSIENQYIYYKNKTGNVYSFNKNYYTSLKVIVKHMKEHPNALNVDTWNESQIEGLIRVLILSSKEFEDKMFIIRTLYLYK